MIFHPKARLAFVITLFLDGIIGANAVLEPLLNLPFRIACAVSFAAQSFEISNFDEYPSYFSDESTLTIAQTGDYTGVDGILEYVQIISDVSPFFEKVTLVDSSRRIDGYDTSTGQCLFDIVNRRQFVPKVGATTPGFPSFDLLSSTKIFYDLTSKKVSRINAYFPVPVFQYVFNEMLGSANTISFVCDVMAGPCASLLTDHNSATCAADLTALPGAEGDDLYIDGNSRGCRVLHAALASTNPEGHCAHVSLSTTDLDPNNENKCSVSAQTTVSSLFSGKDLDYFREFASKQGVDPDSGLVTPSPPISEPGFFGSIFNSAGSFFGLIFDILFGGFFY